MDLNRALIRLIRNYLISFPGEPDFPTVAIREVVRRHWAREIPHIARAMRRRHLTLDEASPTIVVRDALFRLWRSLVPTGDLADFLRDSQDDAVLAALLPQLTQETPVREVLSRTATAALDLAF